LSPPSHFLLGLQKGSGNPSMFNLPPCLMKQRIGDSWQGRAATLKNKSRRVIQAVPVKNRLATMTALFLVSLSPLVAAAQSDGLNKRLEQAATLIRDKRVDEAERQLNRILKASPNEAQALNLLGTIRAGQGRLAEAEALFTRALRSEARLIAAHMNLAYLYQLKGAPDKTISELKEVLSIDPDHAEALYKLARLLLSEGRFDECINLIDNSRQREPSVALLVTRGDAYLKKGDADKAEESYLLALGRQRNVADALLGLAQVYASRGDAKSNSYYLSRARELAGNSPDLLYRFAVAALKAGIYEEARSALEQAITLRPDDAAYHIALGATWLKKPDLFAAEQAFRRALQIQPDSPQGHMYLGYALLKQKKYAEARDHLEKSIRVNSGLPEPLYYLGLIAQEQNEDERAVGILEKVVERFPAFANAHAALGSSYMKLKNYERARQELELAVKLNPDEAKAHYNLAMLYARLKDPQRAQEHMQIVEKLKTSSTQPKEGDAITPPPGSR
jgi:tetratricopeptide (TPR) repeat protein